MRNTVRYFALACDYDGTLAFRGRVDDPTVEALRRLRASGRKLLLVTGRNLDDLLRVFPHAQLFGRIVAENGAVVYDPESRELQPLANPPPDSFVRELERREVAPLSVGHVIVATWEPNDGIVLDVIRRMGLELQVIFNKGAVMVLPSGVNKATGLRRALDDLKISPHNTVGIGDAENDHAFLDACECGVAVANALDSIQARVDLVTEGDHGAGVVELIDRIIASDLSELNSRLTRHDLMIGKDEGGAPVRLPARQGVLLITGPSGSGKSTVTTAFLEQLYGVGCQFCILDPEGDYHQFPGAIALHGSDQRALADETLRVLDRPRENASVALLDLQLEDRQAFLQVLMPRLLEMRVATGRPHWIVIDEAHHLLPASSVPAESILSAEHEAVGLVTVHPDHVAPAVLRRVDTVIVVGRDAQATLASLAGARGEPPIVLPPHQEDVSLAWLVRSDSSPMRFRPLEPTADRRRHRRKYSEGELGEDKSFYFRGPENRLNLRAQNLELFMQLADGVDDETWRYHLREHDVSQWFRTAIKDDALADEARAVEEQADMPASESRARIRAAIQLRYTAME
jgi:hydroxymethylpyrimidine pyrophosphatase-like HAD family hydrolase